MRDRGKDHHERHAHIRRRTGSGAGGERREQVEQTIAALNADDAAGFAGTYSPDAIVDLAASPEPMRGRPTIKQDTQQWITAMPEMTTEIEEVAIDGPTASMGLLFAGTHTGPLMTASGKVTPTGRRMSVPKGSSS